MPSLVRFDIDEGVEGRGAGGWRKPRIPGRVCESVDAARIAEQGVEPGGRVEQGPATRRAVGCLPDGSAEVGPAGRAGEAGLEAAFLTQVGQRRGAVAVAVRDVERAR